MSTPLNDETTTRKPWETPRVESSEVFSRAALACCQPTHPIFGFPTGEATSSGVALPAC